MTEIQEPTRIAQLRETLNAANANYVIHAHEQLIESAEHGAQQGFGELENMAPTLILHADKAYLAAVIRGDTQIAYKKIKQKLKIKNLRLAAPEAVKRVTGSEIGYVSLSNPGITTIIDSRLMGMDTVYGGCGAPFYTLEIRPQDLLALTQAQVFDFTESKDNLETREQNSA